MYASSKQRLSTSTALWGGVLLSFVMPAIASAQDKAAQSPGVAVTGQEAERTGVDDNATGDIVVTARKRAEDIQTVPISITAYTAKDLLDRNISNLNDLSNTTPGVAITSIAGGNVQNIYLRGLAPGNTANDLNVEANVGVFIDGIYQTSRNTLDIISVLDVSQIEIAKGPQSALYGRSTFAGALGISTGRPAHEFTGTVTGTAGEDDDYRIKGSLSLPISSNLFLKVAGGYLTYDGYGKNAADPKDKLGGTEKYAGTAALEFAPSDNFNALLSGFITHSESENTPETLLPFSSFNCGNKNAATGISLLYCGTLRAREVSSLTPDAPETIAKTRQVSLNLTGHLRGVQVVSVTGYTEGRNRAYNDYDGTAAGLLFGVCTAGNACNPSGAYSRTVRANIESTGAERVDTFSQEIRLQSDDNSPFRWLLGGNYFNSRVPLGQTSCLGTDRAGLAPNERLVQLPITGTVPATGTGAFDFTADPFLVDNANTNQLCSSYAKASTRTFSIFGSLGYQFGDLHVNAEGRYNTDRKRAQVFSVTAPSFAPGFYQPIDGTSVPSAAAFPVVGPPFARSFNSFTPRVTVDYQVTPVILVYANAAKGVRSGGFNTANAVSATGILASEVAYDEESNWTYEGGFKTRLLDRALLLNAAVFHTDWSNAQVSAFTNNPTAVNPVRIVQNAGDIKATGFEAQADLTIMRLFGVGGSVVYSDVKFQKGAYDGSQITQCRVGTTPATYTSAPGCPAIIAVPTANGGTQYVPSLEDKRPPRSVKWQWNAHVTANIPLSDAWRISGRADVNYTGPTYSNLINTVEFGKRTLTNFRLGVEGDRYGIFVFGNNVFDKTYVVNSINQPRAAVPFSGLSVPEIYLGEGRRLGVTATAKF